MADAFGNAAAAAPWNFYPHRICCDYRVGKPDCDFVLGRSALVPLAQLRERILEDARAGMGEPSHFVLATFVILFGVFSALKHGHAADLPSTHTVIFGGQSIHLPVGTALNVVAIIVSLLVALASGGTMAARSALALYWYAPTAAGAVADPILGRPLDFYLFTLPAWQIFAGWLLTLAIISTIMAAVFLLVTGGARAIGGGLQRRSSAAVARLFNHTWIPVPGDCAADIYKPL